MQVNVLKNNDDKKRTPQRAECLRTPWGQFSRKFRATAKEVGQGNNPARVLRRHYPH